MKLTEMLLAELDRETPRSRRALEEVPAGKYDWKPHDKSMDFRLPGSAGRDDAVVDGDGDHKERTRRGPGQRLGHVE